MGDDNQLQRYIDLWWGVVGENTALLRSLEADDWTKPTDLPGWDVRCVAAHLAHLESSLAGNPQAEVDVPPAPHVKSPMGTLTEAGTLARAEWPTDAIVEEMETSAAKRREQLAALMPLDPAATADGFAAAIGWSWGTLLSNRVVDQWMHQQDIRRAVGKAGGLDGAAAAHVLGVFAGGLPFVLGKRVRPPAGTSVVIEVTGEHTTTLAATVGEDGRAFPLADPPADPTARLRMDFETFTVLSGGRRSADQVSVAIDGNTDLGATIAANLAVTP